MVPNEHQLLQSANFPNAFQLADGDFPLVDLHRTLARAHHNAVQSVKEWNVKEAEVGPLSATVSQNLDALKTQEDYMQGSELRGDVMRFGNTIIQASALNFRESQAWLGSPATITQLLTAIRNYSQSQLDPPNVPNDLLFIGDIYALNLQFKDAIQSIVMNRQDFRPT